MNKRKAQETINARLDAIVKVGYERLLERIDHVETDGVTVEGDGACNVEVQYFSIFFCVPSRAVVRGSQEALESRAVFFENPAAPPVEELVDISHLLPECQFLTPESLALLAKMTGVTSSRESLIG